MIAVYKGNKYQFISNRRSKEIITRYAMKADHTFSKDKDIYYKNVEEKDLTDIYSIEFFVFYKTCFEGVPFWWKVTRADLINDKVRIRFASGILPDWIVEEKNVCTKLVNYEKIEITKVQYTYKKINGREVDLLVKEENMDLSNLLKKISECEDNNL